MTMEKYGIDYAAVKALLESGECRTEEEALEKVASGKAVIRTPPVDFNINRAQIAALGVKESQRKEGKDG